MGEYPSRLLKDWSLSDWAPRTPGSAGLGACPNNCRSRCRCRCRGHCRFKSSSKRRNRRRCCSQHRCRSQWRI